MLVDFLHFISIIQDVFNFVQLVMNHHLNCVVFNISVLHSVHLFVVIVQLRYLQSPFKGWVFIALSLLKCLELLVILHILLLLIKVLGARTANQFTFIGVARGVLEGCREVITVKSIIQVTVIAQFPVLKSRVLVWLACLVVISRFIDHLAFCWWHLQIRCLRIFGFVLGRFNAD